MNIKESKTYFIAFSQEDAKLIDSLIREQVGSRTIEGILNEFSYVFHWYKSLFTLIDKMSCINTYQKLDFDEYNVLANVLSKAYNDGKHEESKEQIKGICDAIDLQMKGC